LGMKHKVEHHMDVVRTIGVDIEDKHLEVHIPEEASKSVSSLMKGSSISKGDFIVAIHAAPQHKTHCWFNERFAKVADIISERYGAKVVFTGTAKDVQLIDDIRRLMRNFSVNTAGKTSIKEYFALIDRASLLISVDTSAMHVGAAVNTPVIALFGAGNPRMWRPYGAGHIVIYKENDVCTGCLRHSCWFRNMDCMRAISVDDVLRAVDSCIPREKILNKEGKR